jgi:poly-gamma-glutamate synthesis protein (capsule biosynthesis protein)
MRLLRYGPAGRRRSLIFATLALAAAVVLAGGLLLAGAGRIADPAASVVAVAAATPSAPTASASYSAIPNPTEPTPTPSPTVDPPTYSVPVIPIESFWSVPASVDLMALSNFWSGRVPDLAAQTPAGQEYSSLVVAASAETGLRAYFGAPRAASVRVLASGDVKAAVKADPTALGLISADDLTPDVRALSIDGIALFGSGRSSDPGSWRLNIASAAPWAGSAGGVWTVAAGGDVNLDRRIYIQAVTKHMGPDYPWSGGIARVTGYSCCGMNGATLVNARTTGSTDALRDRFRSADIALVNFEGSAPANFEYRPNSLIFTFDPELLAGLRDAGIDVVSLANNHIRNAGDQGISDTCANLESAGIAHVGAGATESAARQPAWFSAGGRRVAVLAYTAVGVSNWVTSTHPGAAALRDADVTSDIRAAKAAGADVVIVVPHWGQEFSYLISSTQKRQAAEFVAAGADLILGSHSHWVGGMQSMVGPNGTAFVDYSMGDLLFDLNHDTQALEAEVVTLSFAGARLVQVQIDPTVMVGGAQVGLLNPATDGKRVLDAIRAASRNLLDW